MKYAMMRYKRGEASVIPIILLPADWLGTTPFGKLQALPTGGKPIALWKNSEDAFFDITQGLRRVINTMRIKSPSIQSTQTERQIMASEPETISSKNVTVHTTKESSSRERLDYLEQLIHRYYSSMREIS